MAEPRPVFTRLKLGRKGYDADRVDAFVDRVLDRVNGGVQDSEGLSSHELAIETFDEARGSSAYAEEEVDQWRREMRQQISDLEKRLHEEDIPQEREGSAMDIGAPPHYADRFPRVSRAVLGFDVHEVDQAMDQMRAAFQAGQGPTAQEILSLTFHEENGGYRQVAVAQALELIAMARNAR